MSEELLQTIPQQIGKYTYYRLGNTTLAQLRTAGIIPKKNYAGLEAKRPDGLVAYHGKIKAVVEYKQPKEIQTDAGIAKAIAQEIKVAKALCKLLVVTDGSKSIWVNAISGDRIKSSNGQELKAVFHPFIVKNLATLEYLLDEVTGSVSATNSTIQSAKLVDPTPLAARLWQTIWVATGKSPVKCLYNVIELIIFKFLSDLNILSPDDAFQNIHKKSLSNPEEALEFYAWNTRKKIWKLFPPSPTDGTTIINGTIFVAEDGEPNLSQSILFQRSLGHLQKYGEEFGSLTKIDKQFKTKLYESFLQQEVEALGQYFTPRKVIRSVIRMAAMDAPTFQFYGKRICDPFCGVGGFLLELLNMNESMMACYAPNVAANITPPFTLNGFDKGFERDDERTIILAKANMLIYLAELLFKNPSCSKAFSATFNDTFKLFKDNLGTFGHIIDSEDEKYDFILSNPPYVTSGSSIIKEEIQKTPRTAKEYPINAMGLEGLSLEWIVKSLRKGGQAYVIIPDGILGRVGDKKLRNYILSECYLDAIVSLPERTFFSNNEHTYILAITKKNSPSDVQVRPVFTYLISEIGEKRTSVKRLTTTTCPRWKTFSGSI
ncbi:MAG: N-6 DNA methylase [Calditrichaeota bacterium]|nr:N-6 DNA methylase [Calditrichota bacterium]